MNQQDDYQAQVSAFYKAILQPEDNKFLKDALALAPNFTGEKPA